MILLQTLLEALFPSLCKNCDADCNKAPLCESCWELSRLIDPFFRCIHCFELSETTVCSACYRNPKLPYPRYALFEKEAPILRLIDQESTQAMAAFAYVQLEKLKRLDFDYLVPVVSSPIADSLATLCNRALLRLFRRRFFLGKRPKWELRANLLEQDAAILLFDPGCELQELEEACFAIAEAFPKRVHILSLHL